MKPVIRIGATAVGLAFFFVLSQSCSDPTSNSSSGPETTLDLESVSTGIAEMSTIVAVCRTGSGSSQAPEAEISIDEVAPTLLARLLEMRKGAALLAASRTMSLPGVQPPDKLGECGGRATFVSYDHANGTTSGTYEYQDYCTQDDEAGTRTVLDGRITFKDTGTPGPSGPITSKVEAGSPYGVTETTRTISGQLLGSRLVKFEDYEQTVGVPGGDPTSGSPDRMKAKEFSFTNQASGKTYRQTDYTLTSFVTPSGGEQMTLSGRGYRSNGEYFNVSTTSPLTASSSGDFTGGQITFSGAENSVAVLSVVPGSVPQGTLTVNGQPVTNVPVCR